MNVEVENLPNCLATLHVELPPETVTKGWNEIAKEFRQAARIPGFRPGKAPQSVVEAKFRKEIQEELTRKLVSETTREAIREKGLKVLSISEVEDVEFTPERKLRFTATLITSPEFEVPEYRQIPLPPVETAVSEEDLNEALERVRHRFATFTDVNGRALTAGDYAVIDFTTNLDGAPLAEAVPQAPKMLKGGEGLWMMMKDDMVLPGFVQALEGMQIEETRRFNLPVPEVYAVDELATKALEFTVTLKAIKQKELPPLDDALAGQVAEGATLESLTDVLRRQLEEDRKQQAERTKRNQIIDYLVSRVECELPQSYLKDETRRIMSDIVQQNQELGVSEEALRKNQKNIVSAASRSARDRLKANFILERIAQEEGMKVEPDELRERIRSLANQNGTSYEKLLSDLQTRGVLSQLQEEILLGKVLDFLSSNATVQASSGEAAPPA